jgi:hypothetical protein
VHAYLDTHPCGPHEKPDRTASSKAATPPPKHQTAAPDSQTKTYRTKQGELGKLQESFEEKSISIISYPLVCSVEPWTMGIKHPFHCPIHTPRRAKIVN